MQRIGDQMISQPARARLSAVISWVPRRSGENWSKADNHDDPSDSSDSDGYSCIEAGISSMNDSQEPFQRPRRGLDRRSAAVQVNAADTRVRGLAGHLGENHS